MIFPKIRELVPDFVNKIGGEKSAGFRRCGSTAGMRLIQTSTHTGARGGSRTHMRKNPRRILSPQRLPFRHPGDWQYKSNEHKDLLQYATSSTDCAGAWCR
jgi:hypothetical protein